MIAGDFKRPAIASRQRVILARAAAVPYRADGVDHMFCRQTVPAGNFGIACLAPMELPAFGEQSRPRRPVDRAVDAAAAEKRDICRVHDRVDRQRRDVAFEYPHPFRHFRLSPIQL